MKTLTLEDGRTVDVVREWTEQTRFAAASSREQGRWSNSDDLRTTLAETTGGEYVVVTFSLSGMRVPGPYALGAPAAARWFVACGLERELPDALGVVLGG